MTVAATSLPTIPLENGDRLSRFEFERRYQAMPELKKVELVIEIAASSAAIDLHDKKRAYRRNQVREYLVWRTLEGRFDWFRLEADDYVSQVPDSQGIIRSQIFPGLWLAVSALLLGDMPTVLSVLHQGLDSPEHRAFRQETKSL
ncbi:Uma2 family endonuclease [Romeria aff. gracilis LEGE 07310]|uniref:Uma2 family endonuclease n=1 Tax=Vasconcelosia minhoensis LEGE 07310 TaxID=915328 RepID=A0A8J7DP17_9CYAN|nr:Uma2 family endonuclease [Romeria gracilis]MBE9080376.1 Uma2 family endonuclease [Romeria aff. gracilis LEGE 07310]